MLEQLKKCQICPYKCKVNRLEKSGNCKAKDKLEISLVSQIKVLPAWKIMPLI